MSGIQPQTKESIELLKKRKTPFVVALNQVDRIYGWKTTAGGAIQDSLAKQDAAAKREFEDRVKETIVQFAELELNACLYFKVFIS